MTLNDHNNTINGFSSQNPMKKRYQAYTCFLFHFEIYLLTLKSHENNTRNGLPSQNHKEMFLASFVEKSYFTLKLTLHSQKCLANCWLCVLDADAHTDAQSDARSDAEERSHVPQFPRSDNHGKVLQSFCQATIFS